MPWCLTVMVPRRVVSAALSILMLLLRRHKQKQQEGAGVEAKELELPETVSQKVLYYQKAEGGGGAEEFQSCSQPTVPLRPHPRRRKERRQRREELRASIRMSLRESHLIGPDDEVFRQFILDRLDEADHDPYVPPFDCLKSYAYEGRDSPAGSLSSLESDSEEPQQAARTQPRAHLVRLTPWYGAADQDDTF